jgi:hypothetical protein
MSGLPIILSPQSSGSEVNPNQNQEDVWQTNTSTRINRAFETMSKRRKGFPSETRVKRGVRVVHGEKELHEKLGRNDPCPCGSGHRFQNLLHAQRTLRWKPEERIFPRLSTATNKLWAMPAAVTCSVIVSCVSAGSKATENRINGNAKALGSNPTRLAAWRPVQHCAALDAAL